MAANKFINYTEDYLVFVLQLPPVGGILPAALSLHFNSWEVQEVRYKKGTDLELWTSELGLSTTVIKRNGLQFSFQVDANYKPETRQKVLQLFEYCSKGCSVNFTFNRFNSYVPNFPQVSDYVASDFETQSVNLPYACIGSNDNFIDSTHDGHGILFGENSTVAFTVKETVNPYELMPCMALSMNDFDLQERVLDNDGTGDYIWYVMVKLNPNGLIERFLDHPEGTITRTTPPSITPPSIMEFVSINAGQDEMKYAEIFVNYVTQGQIYLMQIPHIKVLLKTGETCYIDFSQEIGI